MAMAGEPPSATCVEPAAAANQPDRFNQTDAWWAVQWVGAPKRHASDSMHE